LHLKFPCQRVDSLRSEISRDEAYLVAATEGEQQKLLIVDDDAVTRRLLEAAL
jgi:hypothetical protein